MTIFPLLYDKGFGASKDFSLVSSFEPNGDQPVAIKALIEGIRDDQKDQVLLGITGSGKTFTMAHVIQELKRPALILAPNKILAAQLYAEMTSFFPDNAVEYFVSYYDYYQPEAYIPRSNTYIEKTATINEQIDRMRHSATRALLERRDVIIVASVSCIYGIGGVNTYSEMIVPLNVGQQISPTDVVRDLVKLHYKRNDLAFVRGSFRLKGDILDLFPAHYEDRAWRISFFGNDIENIYEIDSLTGEKIASLDKVLVFANSHYVTPGPTMAQAIKEIEKDMIVRVNEFRANDKLIEAQRIEEKTRFDLEMMVATGTCQGIENYSRYLTGRASGEPPPTLFEYIPKDALLFVDESHVSVPQINGMYRGDRARKLTLSEFGFRLPSCADNRPLKFEEWDAMRPQTVFVSATPGPWEIEQTQGVVVEQIIRPTGLVDPPCSVRPCEGQIDDLMHECRLTIQKGLRILVTTLTKKMAEALTDYLDEAGLKVKYLHSDIETLERIEIIRDLRLGAFDVLVGINLLREGLDIPECGLVAILDADKEGFLRSKTSLIQTIGRAARNAEGHVILYADKVTESMSFAMKENQRRRDKQIEYNALHGITPQTIRKAVTDVLINSATSQEKKSTVLGHDLKGKKLQKTIDTLRKQMLKAASDLDFEEAAALRDKLKSLEEWSMTVD